jgi:hypothetical protein
MNTATDICNLALSHIGKGKITSFNDNSEAARKCQQFYTIARQHVLVDHDWNFASATRDLAVLANEDTYEDLWTYAYQYPSKALRVKKVYVVGSENKNSPDPFKIVHSTITKDKVILSDVEDAAVEYTLDIEDVTMFSSQFEMALSFFIANLIAMALTGDKTVKKNMLEEYRASLSRARQVNQSEQVEDRSGRLSEIESSRA